MPQEIFTPNGGGKKEDIKSIAVAMVMVNKEKIRNFANLIPIKENNIEPTQDSKETIKPKTQRTIRFS